MAGASNVRVGRRVPLSVRAGKQVAAPSDVYVCGTKPLDVGSLILTEGVEVPGAAGWTRVDAWVNARRIRKISPGETYVTFKEFTTNG